MKKILVAAAVLAPTLMVGAAAYAAANSASDTAAVSATIVRPITVTKTQDLAFGTIVKPSSGSALVTLTAASSPVRTVVGGDAIALASTTPTDAKFTVSGEGGQLFTLVIDPSIVMTNTAASGGTLTVTTSNDAGCTTMCTLSGALGDVANGTLSYNVGGSFTVLNTTNTGKYTGSVMSTATYN